MLYLILLYNTIYYSLYKKPIHGQEISYNINITDFMITCFRTKRPLTASSTRGVQHYLQLSHCASHGFHHNEENP